MLSPLYSGFVHGLVRHPGPAAPDGGPGGRGIRAHAELGRDLSALAAPECYQHTTNSLTAQLFKRNFLDETRRGGEGLITRFGTAKAGTGRRPGERRAGVCSGRETRCKAPRGSSGCGRNACFPADFLISWG